MAIKFKPPKFSQSEVSQTINLKDVFGIDFKDFGELKQIIGEELVNTIRKRTENNISVSFTSDGSARFGKLKKYSKDYISSPDFKAFGKSAGDVNMTLTGDMLNLMDFTVDGNKIKIGWDDPTENAKAYNHNVGDTLPKRPFFGVTKGDLLAIVSDLKPKLKEALAVKKDQGREAFNEAAMKIIDELSGDDNG